MDRRTREAARYLGYGKHAVDEQTRTLIGRSFQELDEAVSKRVVYRIFELECAERHRLKFGILNVESVNLNKNLNGCKEVVVFGATLGTGADMLLKKRAVTDMAAAAVLQACAAALLEEYCDEWQEKMRRKFLEEGKYLRPRFSPGYGDFPVTCQAQILQMLDSARKIGLTMTESSMLVPTKSVTAVIGVSEEKTDCHREGCEACIKTNCLYRRI